MMLHIRKFAECCTKHIDFLEPIYEFGSYQVQSADVSDLRPFFPGKQYIGTDMRPGPGVDLVMDVTDTKLDSESVGSVVLLETLEHVKYPFVAMAEARRILQPEGVVIISSVFNFPIHAHPDDYWRFTPSAFELLLADFRYSIIDWNGDKKSPKSVVGVGFKGEVGPVKLEELSAEIGKVMVKNE